MRALVAVLLLTGVARAEDRCEASPEVQAAIATAREGKDATERLKHLVAAHPDDLFVQEAYLDQASFEDYAATRAQYKALYEQNAKDPRYAFLYARLVSYANAREALALLKDLDYPRAHLMSAGNLSQLKDTAGARRELDRYTAACPHATDGWALRLRLTDKKAKPAEIAKLRQTIASRTDPAALALYAVLWRAEFQAAAPPRHPALRKQVAADLQRMRAAAKSADLVLLRAFDEGYKLTSDTDGQAWVKSQQKADPNAFMHDFEAWMKAHPYPPEKATRAERDAHTAAQFAASAEWVKAYPDSSFAWTLRLGSAPRELPAAQIKAIAAKLLALDEGSQEVAATYAARGIDVDKVPAMVERSLARSERRWASQRAQPDRFTGMAGMVDEEEASARFGAWDTLSRVYAAQHDAAKSRDLVAKIKAAADRDKPEDEMHRAHQAALWNARARLALAERKKADALGYFVKARALTPGDDDDELRALWKELGGGDEAFAALSAGDAKKPDEAAWKKKEVALPAFSLTDLAGKTWKSSELKGKTVLLVSWATWCGPCKEELPHLEKLYQQTKKRADVVVASLNVDWEIGLVEPFIKENKYTFPVLLSGEWASDLRGGGIPLAWIADRTFVVRLEKLGYDPAGKFVEETLAAIDQVAKPQPRE